MAQKTARSKSKSKKGKNNEPPPPPPTIIGIKSREDFETFVQKHKGSALVAVVTTLCPISTNTIIPFLEKLNDERPAALESTNIIVLYANDDTADLCRELEVVTVPFFVSYSYGSVVQKFAGDNTEKVLLIAKLAAAAAEAEAARLEEVAKNS